MSVRACRPVAEIWRMAGRLVGRPALRVDRGVGERDHDGQVVGDDVVHLTGDTGPLLGDRQPRLAGRVRRSRVAARSFRAAR